MAGFNDFGPVASQESLLSQPSPTQGSVSAVSDKGAKTPRGWLRSFETLPSQLLNPYGRSGYVDMDTHKVWVQLKEPLNTGAKYMSELTSPEEERQGTGINRWLQVLITFLEYQMDPKIKEQNKVVMRDQLFEELYAEIDRILPSARYCLAQKKQRTQKGASALRYYSPSAPPAPAAGSELERHAQVLYDFTNPEQVSRVRMLINWQGAGGLTHCVQAHHRAVTCYRLHGDSQHMPDQPVTLEKFQRCVRARHAAGSSCERSSQVIDDFSQSGA